MNMAEMCINGFTSSSAQRHTNSCSQTRWNMVVQSSGVHMTVNQKHISSFVQSLLNMQISTFQCSFKRSLAQSGEQDYGRVVCTAFIISDGQFIRLLRKIKSYDNHCIHMMRFFFVAISIWGMCVFTNTLQ